MTRDLFEPQIQLLKTFSLALSLCNYETQHKVPAPARANVTAFFNKKHTQSLTNSPDCPVVDELTSTESKILEREILQLSFSCLKPIVGKENNGSVIPAISNIKKTNK